MRRRTPAWLLSEPRRTATASIVAILLATVVLLLYYMFIEDESTVSTRVWFPILLAWSLLSLVMAVLTWWAYRGRKGDDLRTALAIGTRARRPGGRLASPLLRFLLVGGEAVSFSVQLSIMALIGLAGMILTPGLRSDVLIVSTGIALVITSWVHVFVQYGVHYARLDHESGGLEFPGSGTREFSDYMYFAVAGQTTFGATDVNVTTAEMRRLVTSQGLIAFAFNTIIIALGVALIVSGV